MKQATKIMKREGYTYRKTYNWDNLTKAEESATKGKLKRHYVKSHLHNRIRNLCEIQSGLIDKTIRTDEYKHKDMTSVQGKVRKISKLNFHPNHIYHQSLVTAGEKRVEKNLIYDTYASRKGKGQIAGALRVKQWLLEHPDETLWYGQGDIRKFYQSIPHDLLRRTLESIYKDQSYIDAMMEPINRFGDIGIPLGIRPSQIIGNLILSSFDHWAKEEMGMKFYIRYMDDYVVLGKTKGEVKRFMKKANERLAEMGFKTHVPKIHRVSFGLSYLGFMIYPGGDLYWRKRNKSTWLKRRSHATNKKRLKEIDAAAWGMLKHGNKHCKRLYYKMTGVDIKRLGIKANNSVTGRDGKKFFDVPRIGASVVINDVIDILEWEKDIRTSQGSGRWVLLIRFHEKEYRLIINSIRIKNFIETLEEHNVTSFRTVMTDRSGNKHYDFDYDRTSILSISGSDVYEKDGEIIHKDKKQQL